MYRSRHSLWWEAEVCQTREREANKYLREEKVIQSCIQCYFTIRLIIYFLKIYSLYMKTLLKSHNDASDISFISITFHTVVFCMLLHHYHHHLFPSVASSLVFSESIKEVVRSHCSGEVGKNINTETRVLKICQ